MYVQRPILQIRPGFPLLPFGNDCRNSTVGNSEVIDPENVTPTPTVNDWFLI